MEAIRSDLVLVHQADAPFERAFLLNDRATNRYWAIGPVQYEMARIFSRTLDWDAACAELRSLFDEPISETEIKHAYDEFAALGLVELSPSRLADLPMKTYRRALSVMGVRHHPLLDQYASPSDILGPAQALGEEKLMAGLHRALHMQRASEESAHVPAALRWMRVQVPLFDPNAQLERWMPRLGFMFSSWFFVLCAALALLGFSTYFDRAREVHARLGYVSGNLGLLFFCTVLMLVVHEYAHALTCKRFGGEVREMGIIVFLFFIPAAYCDVSDAHLFSGRRQKLWVTMAGTWSTFVLASLGALIWSNTVPTATLNHFALVLMASGYATVLTNLNPLLPLDGYFFLSDWIGIDNLRDRAPDYCKAYLVALFTGKPGPEESPRHRRFFWAYFVFGSLYQIFYLCMSVGFGWLILVRGGTLLGLLLYGALVYLFYIRNYVIRLVDLWREARTKQLFTYALGVAAFIAIVGFVPLQTTVAVPATVHEKGRVSVVAPQSALIEQMASDGSRVEKGDVLFKFKTVTIEAPASGTLVYARDWILKAPVAAGEPLASIVTGYMIEGALPQRWVEDARRARWAKATIGAQDVLVDDVWVTLRSKDGKQVPVVQVGIVASAENPQRLDEGALARLEVRSRRTMSVWRRMWGDQWDRVVLDVWRLL